MRRADPALRPVAQPAGGLLSGMEGKGEQSQRGGTRPGLRAARVPGCLELRVPTGARYRWPWRGGLSLSWTSQHECCGCGNSGESATASSTFPQIKPGPECPGQLFSAESLCVFTLPPQAELTAGLRNAALAGSVCEVRAGLCVVSGQTRSESVVRAELLALIHISCSCGFEK